MKQNRDRDSSGGASAPPGAADMLMRHHMGEPGRRARRRIRGHDYAGRNVYHVVAVTCRRNPLLVGGAAAHAAAQIRAAADKLGFELLSFVVMPDHAHVLVQGRTDSSDLIRFVQRFKQATGYAYKRATGESLWQWSFYDRILRNDEDVAAIALYIAENPERAGLTTPGRPWPYAGAVLVEETREWLPTERS